jgi:hypothetical protein
MTPEALDVAFKASAGTARRLIDRRLADARAHAQLGRTAAAIERLDELGAALGAHLRDARQGFHAAALDGSGLVPDRASVHVARNAKILGRDQALDLVTAIKDAKAGLRGLLIGGAPEPHRLVHWEAAHGSKIEQQITGSLSNSQMAIHHAMMAVLSQ